MTGAFSLVEMLMALLVASLLLAALAPVITKRFTENVNVAGATGGGRAPAMFKCWDYDSPELQMADDDTNYKVLPNPYNVDEAWNINFIIASGGGGGAGATIPNETEHDYDGINELKIEPTMDEIDIVSMIGAGGGAGGGAAIFSGSTCTGSPSASKCECMGYKFDNKNTLCVSGSRGTAIFSNTASKCTSLPKDTNNTGWVVPSSAQLANWAAIYSTLGITSGTKIWSSTSGTGACSNGTPDTYNCYNNGVYKTGQASSYACCSGSSYGAYGFKKCPSSNNRGSFGSGLWVKCSSGCFANGPHGSANCQVYGSGDCQKYGGGSFSGCVQFNSVKCESASGATVCSTPGANGDGSTKVTCNSTVTKVNGNCNSYYTNYYYSELSGSSWSNTFVTSNSGAYDVYCVYNGTGDVIGESFYSLSGGGGGGAPAIQDNSFDSNILNMFRNKVKENVGGYLVFKRGKGGQGGTSSSNKNQKASDGKKGEDTCIVIQDSTHKDKYKLCVSGGNFGYGADATKSDSSSTGWGKGASKTDITNACYVIDYSDSSNPDGIKTTFDCTKEGKQGGNGGASTNNPTSGGSGGASVLNNTQVSNNGKDGITPSSSNYGAGGGGGTATKTGSGSSATLAFGNGGNGSDGYIKIHYKHKYAASGGGGGGGGAVANITNISVGKTATCDINIKKRPI